MYFLLCCSQALSCASCQGEHAHQPVNFGSVADGGQQCPCHQVRDLGRLLVNEVGHLLLCGQHPPGSADDNADQVGAHVLCPGCAQDAVLPILYQAELSSTVYKAHLGRSKSCVQEEYATLLCDSCRLSGQTYCIKRLVQP